MFLSPSFNGDSFNGIPLPFPLLAAAPLSLCPGSCVQGYGKGTLVLGAGEAVCWGWWWGGLQEGRAGWKPRLVSCIDV